MRWRRHDELRWRQQHDELLQCMDEKLDMVLSAVRALNQRQEQTMSIEQDILDAVGAETTLVASNTVLLEQLKALANPTDLPKLQQALTNLLSNNTALAQAQVDNTPAADVPVDQSGDQTPTP